MSDETKSNPFAAMIRVEPKGMTTYAGQRSHDLRLGHQPDYVDHSRSDLNIVLIEPPKPSALRAICQDRRDQRNTKRAMRSDAAVAFVGLIGFGAEAHKLFTALPLDRQKTAILEAAERCASRMDTTLEGAVMHLDESSLHVHLTYPAYDLSGRPLTTTVKRAILAGMQDDLADVMGKYAPGIERGRSRVSRIAAGADYAETVHMSVRELHQALPAELDDLRTKRDVMLSENDEIDARLAELKADLARIETEAAAATEKRKKNERLAAKALSDLEAGKGEAEKVAKRAALYEARAATAAEAEIAAHDKRTEILAEIEVKADLIAAGIKAVVAEVVAGTIKRHPETGKILMKDPEPAKAVARDLLPLIRSGADAAGEIAEIKARASADATAAAVARVRAETDARAVKEARRQLEAERAEFEVERLTLADQARKLVDQVTKWIRQVQPLAADAEIESETAIAVRKAFPEAKNMRQKLRDVFEALGRRGKPREGILGQMQERADAELLRPVDAALRPLSAPPGQPGPKSGPSGLEGPGF